MQRGVTPSEGARGNESLTPGPCGERASFHQSSVEFPVYANSQTHETPSSVASSSGARGHSSPSTTSGAADSPGEFRWIAARLQIRRRVTVQVFTTTSRAIRVAKQRIRAQSRCTLDRRASACVPGIRIVMKSRHASTESIPCSIPRLHRAKARRRV